MSYKIGDLVLYYKPNSLFLNLGLIKEIKDDGSIMLFNSTIPQEKKNLYKSLSDIFESHKEKIEKLISILNDKDIVDDEYYYYLKIFNELFFNEKSIFNKALKVYLGKSRFFFNKLKQIKEKNPQLEIFSLKEDRPKIKSFLKEIFNNINVDKIGDFLKQNRDEEKLKNVLEIFNDKILMEIEELKEFREKIKYIVNKTFLNLLIEYSSSKKNLFEDSNINYLVSLFYYVDSNLIREMSKDFSYDETIKLTNYSIKINKILSKSNSSEELKYKELLSNKRILDDINYTIVTNVLYNVIDKFSKEEFDNNINHLINEIKNYTSKGGYSNPAYYQELNDFFEKMLIFQPDDLKESPLKSLKELYKSQRKNIVTLGENLLVLNALFSMGLFADKISVNEIKEKIDNVVEILNNKEELEEEDIELEEIIKFLAMDNYYGSKAIEVISDYPVEKALKKQLSVAENFDLDENLKKIKNPFIVDFLNKKIQFLLKNNDSNKENYYKETKEVENIIFSYVNELFKLKNSSEKSIENVKNIYIYSAALNDINSKTYSLSLLKDGDLSYLLKKLGTSVLKRKNLMYIEETIKYLVSFDEEKVVDFIKNIALNGIKGIIKYLESEDYQYINTKFASYIGEPTTMFDEMQKELDKEDLTIKRAIYKFMEDFVLRDKNVKFLISQKDEKINMLLISMGFIFHDKSKEQKENDIDKYHFLLNYFEKEDIAIISNIFDRFKVNLFNYSLFFNNLKTNLFHSLFFTRKAGDFFNAINNKTSELLNVSNGNLLLTSLIIRDYILDYIFNVRGYSNLFRVVGDKELLESYENFLNKILFSFRKELKIATQDKNNIFYIKRIFENMKGLFLNRNEQYRMNFSFNSNGSADKYKLYEIKLLVPFYSMLKDIFLNGITKFGDKEQHFIKNTFLQPELFNKWIEKSEMLDEIFIRGGLLSVLYKIDKDSLEKKLTLNSFKDKDKILTPDNLKSSLQHLPKNFIIYPSNIPPSAFEKNSLIIAKIVSNERLFGLDEDEELTNEELIDKIKVAEFYGILSIKNEMEKNGIEFQKNKNKENKIEINN